MTQTRPKSKSGRALSSYGIASLVYLLVVAVIWSPYFTPSGEVGLKGIIRADQVILPCLVTALVLSNSRLFRLPTTSMLGGLVAITLTIAVSIVANTFLFGGANGLGDLFDVLIWLGYVGLVATVAGNVPEQLSRRALLLIIGLSGAVAALTILQYLNVPFTTNVIAPLYTADASLEIVSRRPTGTSSNPNTLAKLLTIPLYFAFAQVYRYLVIDDVDKSRWAFLSWAALFGTFLIAIFLTGSRSSIVAAAAGFLLVSVFLLSGRLGEAQRRMMFVAVGGFVAITIGTLALSHDRFDVLLNPLQDSSLQRRFDKWRIVLPVIVSRPILGHSPSIEAVVELGIRHIDSGVLSWWYHYGLVGFVGYVVVVVGALKVGAAKMTNPSLFVEYPVFWATAVAVVGWFSGSVLAWTVSGVPQSRRLFTLSLLVVSLVYTINVGDRS